MAATSFTPIVSAAGGALIGLSSVIMRLFSSRIAGITGIVRRLLAPYANGRPLEAIVLIMGLVGAPKLLPLVAGSRVTQTVSHNALSMALACLLVGFGTVWANGCNSGHGVCGLSRLFIRSLCATLIFMAIAVATVFVVQHVTGR